MALAVQTAVPQLFPFADVEHNQTSMRLEPGKNQSEKRGLRQYHNMWGRLSRLGHWLKRDEHEQPLPPLGSPDHGEQQNPFTDNVEKSRFLGRRGSRKVVPGLPRPITFRRQNSERRERLCPVEPEKDKRRAYSMDRRPIAGRRTLSPPAISVPSHSAPDVSNALGASTTTESFDSGDHGNSRSGQYDPRDLRSTSNPDFPPREPFRPVSTAGDMTDRETMSDGVDDIVIQQELDAKWILNLSMHFRDMSDREKFFITFAEEPNRWRRVTVSCDYRDVPIDSLEADLKSLHYQRDKSARIYESIRDSLPDIQFYPTVTNLKLQTDDGRLHVHVTEDVNEIIPYPTVSSLRHLPGPRFRESAVLFDSHISGFVYKVRVDGQVFIKKEIPGPDTVEEFLYEINALSTLQTARSVIKYEGLIVDDRGELVKGVLISFAEQGALVDLLFDWKDSPHLPWARRELWAMQIIEGLSEIHEAGFVQGDFTLSNIVVDADDDAKIIDINRRGCPVGWEPPELSKLIESGHRISIYIGVKSDLFQLGMVLWALAAMQDEPERQERPLTWDQMEPDVPRYFREIVEACLSEDPRYRPSAKDLLTMFPPHVGHDRPRIYMGSRHSVSTHHSDKVYIDPAAAVDLSDIERSRHHLTGDPSRPCSISAEDLGFAEAGTSTSCRFGSSASFIAHRRGRSSECASAHGSTSVSASASRGRRSYNYSRSPNARVSSVSLEDSDLEPALNPEDSLAAREHRWEEVYVDGDTKLVQRSGASVGAHDFGKTEQGIGCLTSQIVDKPNEEQVGVLHPQSTIQQEQSISMSTDTLTPIKTATQETDLSKTPPRDLYLVPPNQSPSHLQPRRTSPPFRASFHDRVQLRSSHDSTLADLEKEIMRTSPRTSLRDPTSPVGSDHADTPKIEPLRHYDSGFHEPSSGGGLSGRAATFGSPTHTDSGFHAMASRAISVPRSATFGPPHHSDSGFHENSPVSSTATPTDPAAVADGLADSVFLRDQEDEAKAREAVRKIISGEFNTTDTTSRIPKDAAAKQDNNYR